MKMSIHSICTGDVGVVVESESGERLVQLPNMSVTELDRAQARRGFSTSDH